MSLIAIREREIVRLVQRINKIKLGKFRHVEISPSGNQADVTEEILGDLEKRVEILRRENEYLKGLGLE